MDTIDLPDKKFYDTIKQYQKWQKDTEEWVYKTMGIPKSYFNSILNIENY